jgi:DNA mismatch endonuclease (patch repair protein)
MEQSMKTALETNNIAFLYQPKMFGKPDFLIGKKIVVFCDSSFWHGRNWRQLKKRLPQTYWRKHIENNRKRDVLVNSVLKNKGYKVIRFWDQEINRNVDKCITRIIRSMAEVAEQRVKGEHRETASA